MLFRDFAHDPFLILCQRAALLGRLCGDFQFPCRTGRDQSVNLRLLKQSTDDVAQFFGGAGAQRLAVIGRGLVDELLQPVRLDVGKRHCADLRTDAQPEVRLVGIALGRADMRRLIGAIPLPRPLLNREFVRRAAAIGQRF